MISIGGNSKIKTKKTIIVEQKLSHHFRCNDNYNDDDGNSFGNSDRDDSDEDNDIDKDDDNDDDDKNNCDEQYSYI